MPISAAASVDASPEALSPAALSPHDIVSSGLCIGCGVCLVTAPPGAGMQMDAHGQLKPSGPPAWYRGRTQAFAKLCPFSPHALNETDLAQRRFAGAPATDERIGRFEAAYVGYAAEGTFRETGSSGGMVSWVAAELLRRGLVDGVVHVRTHGQGGHPFFAYGLSGTLAGVCEGAKSRYYPVELSGMLALLRALPGRYAVVGIPCFIKAVQLLRAHDRVFADRIAFTLGLFCGHMKSARMVESFAWQLGLDPEEAQRIDYRLKDPRRPANWYRAQVTLRDDSQREQDWWHLVDGDWGSGFFQNPACNFCDDVAAETADIAFGDAWVEPYSSDGRGTNVVVARSAQLRQLLDEGVRSGRLQLQPVDAGFVAETQAAGFRQRREGLAYRLSWPRRGVQPVKRVAPSRTGIPLRRKLVYRLRHHISRWSHRMFYVARALHMPVLFISWGRAMLAVYQAVTYSRGRLGRLADRLLGERR